MKSKAHIKTHPIHPMLIPFPIAFLIGSFVFDLLALGYGNQSFWTTGGYLQIAGICTALLAAIPGIIDYRYTVPPDSSASKRAAKHGIINTLMLVIFIAAYFLRPETPALAILAAELAGLILLSVAGWMGGTLVHRNHIGVYNRYANSGKWKETHITSTDRLIEVGLASDLKEDQMKLLIINNKRIVLARTNGAYVAFDDHCSHKGGSLAGGTLICGRVQCPWHGSQFDVCSGQPTAAPASEGIATYQLRQEAGKLLIDIDSNASR